MDVTYKRVFPAIFLLRRRKTIAGKSVGKSAENIAGKLADDRTAAEKCAVFDPAFRRFNPARNRRRKQGNDRLDPGGKNGN